MALIPLLLDYLDQPRPSRIHDQHFGHGLTHEDLSAPILPREFRGMIAGPHYMRPWRGSSALKDTGSTVTFDKNKFQVNLDVQQFTPGEITVKVTGENTVTIEGKHEEKPDEHGFISRHFIRRYIIPKGHNLDRIESKLSSDGVLTISAPTIDQAALEHRHVPVIQTGQPSRAIKDKSQENGEGQ